MDKAFWKKGLQFSCTQCSACCRFEAGFVFLSEKDLAALLKWAAVSRKHFIQIYCRWVLLADGYRYLCLKEKSNFDCILWKDGGCSAYEYRPLQCSAFPFWDDLLNDKVMWQEAGKDCPGIGCGKSYSAAEIRDFLKKQEKEPYIRTHWYKDGF